MRERQEQPTWPRDAEGPLARCLVDLAETPDEASDLDERLALLTRLAADRIAAADFASVTTLRAGAYTTVAVSSELVRAVDEIQNEHRDGPCIDALHQAKPVAAPHLLTTVQWPGFTAEALRLGLRATLSVPVFTAGGTAAASLNLHGRDDEAMAPLIDGVWAIFDPDRELPRAPRPCPDEGGRELLAGFAEAVAVRATIQRALYAVMERHGEPVREAYLRLTGMAARTRSSVRDIARALLGEER